MDAFYRCNSAGTTDEELPASASKWARVIIDEDDPMDEAMADYIDSEEYLTTRNALNWRIGVFRRNLTSAAQQEAFVRIIDRYTNAYAKCAIEAFDSKRKPTMDAATTLSLKQDAEAFSSELTSIIQKSEFTRIIEQMMFVGETYADKAYEARQKYN